MEAQRNYADGVADYIHALSSLTRGNRIDPNGKRIRESFSSHWSWDDSTSDPIKSFESLVGSQTVTDPSIKEAIPIVPLPFDKHYISSLKPLIRPGHPLPSLTFTTPPSEPMEADQQRKALDAVAGFLHKIIGMHLNEGELPEEVRRDDVVSEQSLRFGISGYRLSKVVDGEFAKLAIETIPREAVYISDNGRFVGLINTLYQSDPDSDEYDFEWEDDNPMDAHEFMELYDRDGKMTYYLDRETEGCRQVKDSEKWPAGQDAIPVVFESYGEFDEQSGQYSLGYIWPWAMIWEEMIVALSCIAWYTWQSNQAKLIIAGNTILSEEQKELLVSPHARWVEVGMDLDVKFHNFKPIESTQEWVGYWNFLHNILVQFQFLPNISRGLESPATPYMKAGTAEIMNQVRNTFAQETIEQKKRFHERLYRRLLDFLGANPDIKVVEDFIVANRGIVPEGFLRQDYNIDVNIDEIKADDKDQKKAQTAQLLQAAPPIMQIGQLMQQGMAQIGMSFDFASWASKLFENFGLPPISTFTSPIPQYGGVNPAPPIGVQPLMAQLSQMGQTALADDIVNTGVPPELQDALAQILMQSQRKSDILAAIEEALGAPDPLAALTEMIQRSANA